MHARLNFFKTSMPETRKADIYLGCLDGSVFMDFKISTDNLICLRRISFDGYGCCNLDETGERLSVRDSRVFLKEMAKEEFNQETVCGLVKKIIRMNKDLIWNDALLEYGLLP